MPPNEPHPREPRVTLASFLVLGALLLPLESAWATANEAPQTVEATGSRQSGAARDASPFEIVAFGSSSTQGIGATSPSASYPSQLQTMFGELYHGHPAVLVVNRGIGGEDIDDMARRIGADILSRKPDLVIWQVGSNDCLRRVPLERFRAKLRSGIAAIRRSGAEVLLMEPQWSPATAAADSANLFVGAVRDLGAEEHVEVVRRFELMRQWMSSGRVTERQLIGADRLHMTDLGYAMLSRAVFDEIAARSNAFRHRLSVPVAKRP